METDPRKKLAATVAGAPPAPAAPPAPPAPTVQSPATVNGSMSSAAATSLSGPAPIAAPAVAKKPTASPPPKVGPIGDAAYWNNVMALTSNFDTGMKMNLMDQTMADTNYSTEATRMGTDRSRSRRNLAESLMGSGGMNSGSHRRQQTENQTDFLNNRSRLDQDYEASNFGLAAERADISSRLAPNVGTEWIGEAQAWQDRKTALEREKGDTGDPVSAQSIGEKIKGRNKRIKTMRAKAAKIEDVKKRKEFRKKIQNVRRERDKLVKKRKARNK